MARVISKYQSQIEFTKKKLGKLTDGSGTLIFDHAIRVYLILQEKLSQQKISGAKKKSILLAGLFHDLLEDTNTTEADIIKQANKITLKLVKEMTINFHNCSIKQAVKPLYFTSDELTLIKLADIYDNVRKSPYFLRTNGLKWYKTFFLPLLNEYKNWIGFKLGRQKKYRLLVKGFSQDVLKEIAFLESNYFTFSKII